MLCMRGFHRAHGVMDEVGVGGSCLCSPGALLATTHIAAILWRFDPMPPPDATSQLCDRALELAVDRMDQWARRRPRCTRMVIAGRVDEKIAHALRYLYECRPPMSLRAIGAQPEIECTTIMWAKSATRPPMCSVAPVPGGR